MASNPGSCPGRIGLSELRRSGGRLSGLLRLSELLDSKPDFTGAISPDCLPTLLLRQVAPCMSSVVLSMSTLHPTHYTGWALSGRRSGELGVGDLVVVIRFTSRREPCILCDAKSVTIEK